MPVAVVSFALGIQLPPRAYLDTNFIVHVRDQASNRYQRASSCLNALLQQGVQLYVSALVFDELWWVYLKKSYELLTGAPLTQRDYKSKPGILQTHWPAVQVVMNAIRAWGGFNELPTPVGIVTQAEAIMQTNHLTPRDAFHLALTLHHGIESFITADSDFDTVQLPAGVNLTIIKI